MTNKTDQLASKVEEEHQNLKAHFDLLKASASRNVSPETFSDWKLDFIWQLRDFKNHLLKHFDLEEEGGFMRDVVRHSPQEARLVKRLLHEHATMSQSLDRITDELKAMRRKDSEKLQRVRTQLNDLCTVLNTHEDHEHRLLQRAFHRDYGGTD